MHGYYKKFTNQGPGYFGDLDEADGALLEYEAKAEEEGMCLSSMGSCEYSFIGIYARRVGGRVQPHT